MFLILVNLMCCACTAQTIANPESTLPRQTSHEDGFTNPYIETRKIPFLFNYAVFFVNTRA